MTLDYKSHICFCFSNIFVGQLIVNWRLDELLNVFFLISVFCHLNVVSRIGKRLNKYTAFEMWQ